MAAWLSGSHLTLGELTDHFLIRYTDMLRLHLDTRQSGLPEREVEIRQMTLWACVIYDKCVLLITYSKIGRLTHVDIGRSSSVVQLV